MIRSFLVLLHDLKTLQNIRLTERSRCGAANIWCWNLVLVIALRWPWALLCALATFWVDDVFNGKWRTELRLRGSHFKKSVLVSESLCNKEKDVLMSDCVLWFVDDLRRAPAPVISYKWRHRATPELRHLRAANFCLDRLWSSPPRIRRRGNGK